MRSKSKKKTILLVAIQNAESHFEAWQKRVKLLDPLPDKVIFCENDSADKTVKLISSWDFPHELISFKSKKADLRDDIYAVIARNRQMLLERARQLKPDFAIFFDDDVFPEDNSILDKLSSHNLPLVGGAYLRPFEEGVFLASKWSVDMPLKNFPKAVNLEDLVNDTKRLGYKYLMFSSCHPILYKVTVTSAGCMCMSKQIIQDKRMNFFPFDKNIDIEEGCSEDFRFCLLARQLGYEVYLDGNIKLTHLAADPKKKRPWIK
jgi:hypothetical protein